MKSLFLRVVAIALGLAALATMEPCFGEDYLIIKKKSGPVQRMPLPFPPDEIESFQVEAAPPDTPALTKPSAAAREEQKISPAPQAGPVNAPPVVPPSSEEGVAPQSPSTALIPAQPTERPRKGESQSFEPGKPISDPTATAVPGGKRSFTVSVYKLPAHIRAIPDFSAIRAQKTLIADRINLDPGKGDNEPLGLVEDTEGLGMRSTGTFLVSGEGIFKWRVSFKDGVRLHIDDKTVLENDGVHDSTSKTAFVHLAEGVHTIILDSFNSKEKPVLKLYVEPPLGQEQIFSIGNGLVGWKEPAKPYDLLWGQVYFIPKGKYVTLPAFDQFSPIGRLIAPELSISGKESFPGLPGRKDYVGIRYQGFFSVEGAGVFAFRLLADTYAKLTIGTETVVEVTKGVTEEPNGRIGWAFLQPGTFPITVDYFHPEGEPRLELYVIQPDKESEELFSPMHTITGFPADTRKISMIPAFVYFLEPNTRKMPNFNKLIPSGMLFTKGINYPVDRGSRTFPGLPKREEWFGLRFYVKFSLTDQEAGQYRFRLVADKTARLIIGKKLIADTEVRGKAVVASGIADLAAGSHEMFLDYLQTTGSNGLQLFITPPGGEERVFAFHQEPFGKS
jgi:hypothetical protein